MQFSDNLNNLHIALKSSTLIYAVFVMLIISIICSSLILMSYSYKTIYTSYIEKDRVFANVNSGINLLLCELEIITPGIPQKLSLYGAYNDSVELERKQWGVFELIRCESWWKNFRFEKIVFCGDYYKNDSSFTLYLADKNKPLSLCGKTIINGDCFLPKAGVEKAYIEGKNFEGNMLINGSVKESSGQLPEIDQLYANLDRSYFANTYLETTEIEYIQLEDIQNDTLNNSFLDSTILIYSSEDIIVEFAVLSGNIVLFCENTLEITNTCNFEDILIYGKSVWIEEGFTGSCQIFAKDTINIGEGATFKYPSVIGLVNHNEEGNTKPSVVNIENRSEFFGLIYCSCESEVITVNPILKSNNTVNLSGQIYWNGIFEFKGNIYGTVACNKFLLKTPSSIYENHLLDVTIDLERLSNHYVGVSLSNRENVKKIIKWL